MSSFDLKQIVAERLGENYELHEKYVNPTLVKVFRTIAFDKVYTKAKGQYLGSIEEIETDGNGWAEQHWRTISHAYGRAPHFAQYRRVLEAAYLKAADLRLLTEINELFLLMLVRLLGIATATLITFGILSRSRKQSVQRPFAA